MKSSFLKVKSDFSLGLFLKKKDVSHVRIISEPPINISGAAHPPPSFPTPRLFLFHVVATTNFKRISIDRARRMNQALSYRPLPVDYRHLLLILRRYIEKRVGASNPHDK